MLNRTSVQIQNIENKAITHTCAGHNIPTCEYPLSCSYNLVLFSNSYTEMYHDKHCNIHYNALDQ